MINNSHTFTPAGRIRKPSYSTLAQWVGESWNEIDPRIIRRAFKCCGISVEIDGSEDDLVFNYEILGEDSVDTNEEEALNFDDNNDEYEEIRIDNDWE